MKHENEHKHEQDHRVPEEVRDTRSAWQRTKESWYDKVPLTVRQLDIIIILSLVALAIVALLIARDAGAFSG